MSISIEDLVSRKASFAAGGAHIALPFPTNQILRVVGCVDSRVEPSDVLGLALGDAVVMRNIGGRITPEALRAWALLGRLGQDGPPRGQFVILHHTDCGIRRLADFPTSWRHGSRSRSPSSSRRRSTTRTPQSGWMFKSPGRSCHRACR